MAPKVWHFLLPGSGQHSLRVEDIGTPQQQVFLDEEPLQAPATQVVFVGPEESILELRLRNQKWMLLVNDMMVEDYSIDRRSSGDESLREVKGRPDGSYLISPVFQPSDIELNVVRKFKFVVDTEIHEVKVAHDDCIWQVLHKGSLVDRVSHRLAGNSGEASFDVETRAGHKLRACVYMKWQHFKMVWKYRLVVHGVEVPIIWNRITGKVHNVEPPLVFEDPFGGEFAAIEPPAPEPDDTPVHYECADSGNFGANLAQGVSYDHQAFTFQANVLSKTGKFVFLGDFASADEASEAYLRALPTHRPEKVVAPVIPT